MNGVTSALHFVYICSPLRWMDLSYLSSHLSLIETDMNPKTL
jgi:hypothetical protein